MVHGLYGWCNWPLPLCLHYLPLLQEVRCTAFTYRSRLRKLSKFTYEALLAWAKTLFFVRACRASQVFKSWIWTSFRSRHGCNDCVQDLRSHYRAAKFVTYSTGNFIRLGNLRKLQQSSLAGSLIRLATRWLCDGTSDLWICHGAQDQKLL